MNLKSLFTLLLAGSMAILSACGDDADENGPINDNCANWSDDVADEADAYVAAVQAFSSNPTKAACNTMKTKGHAYLDALETILSCQGLTAQHRQQIQSSISQSEASLDAYNCNQFE